MRIWPFARRRARTFSGTPVPSPLDELFASLATNTGPVSRDEALSVPGILRARNNICSIATLPLELVDAESNVLDWPLGRQFDPDVPNVVHLSQTIEDLLFDAEAWWEVTDLGWDGYPTYVRRVAPSAVFIEEQSTRTRAPLPSGRDPRDGVLYMEGRPVPWSRVIRFDSANPAMLKAAARSIRRHIALDAAAKMYADNPQATQYLQPTEHAPQLTDAQWLELLAQLKDARRKRGVGKIPHGIELKDGTSGNARDLQIAELQKQAGLEIANASGLDPEELGLSTTSRTYSNVQDRRTDKINETLSPYMAAITHRLSMHDVTKRGQTVRINLGGYLKASDADRWDNYKIAKELGVLSPQAIARREGIPETDMPDQSRAPIRAEVVEAEPPAIEPANARRALASHYAEERGITGVPLQLQTFSVDREARVIEGVAVPYGAVGNGARFEKGALKFTDVSRVKLNMDHDASQTVGVMTDAKDGNGGLHVKFRVARTAEGDRALALAEDGVYDGLSIEIPEDTRQIRFVPDPRRRNGVLIQEAPLLGVALTPTPAFADARLTRVKFTNNKEDTVPDTEPTPVETPEVTPPTEPAPQPVPAQFTAEQANAALAALTLWAQTNGQPEPRPVVNPTRQRATTAVQEAVPYRFNRNGALVRGSHDFAADLFAWHQMRDLAAYQRALSFVAHQFVDDPIATADVAALNPTITQGRYVDEQDFAYPLWSRLGRGAPPNGIQAFSWPKFVASGLTVATHTVGVAQDSGDYQTTTQTVNPVGKSARAEIPREVWDMGGTPGISDLIWRKMLRAWGEHREAVIDAALDAAEVAGLAELGTFTAGGGTDKRTLAAEMEAALALLNFARGGFRFEFTATQADLFAALAAAKDTGGRALYPIIAPQNANGGTSSRFAMVNVGGVDFVPSWAAAAAGQTTPVSSFLIDPTAVDAWATAPQRIDIVQSVEYIEIAAWGYMAAAVNDFTGVRHVSYDPVAP